MEDIFTQYGISGVINKDITPETAIKIACALTMITEGRLAVSTDGSNGCIMIKNAVISGILSGGACAVDFGDQPVAITRSGIKFYNLKGGFHISSGGERIEILTENGTTADKVIIDSLKEILNKGKLKRTKKENIKEVVSLQSYKLYYLRFLVNSLKNNNLGFNILLGVKNSIIKNILTPLLEETGCTYTLYKGKKENQEKEIQTVVKNENYDFAAVFSDDGKRIKLYDGKGDYITPELYECIVAAIVFMTEKEKTYVACAATTAGVEKVAENLGGKIIRTNSSENNIMSKVFDLKKEGISTQFILSFDAIGSILKIMDFLKTNNLSLGEVVKNMPEIYMNKKEIPCKEQEKQKIMDSLMKKIKNGIGTSDGIKVYEKRGWALICPDKIKDAISLVCEGVSSEMAEEITADYTRIIDCL